MAKSKKGLRIGNYRITPLGLGVLAVLLLIIIAVVVLAVVNPFGGEDGISLFSRATPTPTPTATPAPTPTPSPTPRPTLMPVSTEKLPKGAYVAVVSNISEDSSLNLRQSPSLSSDVLRRLYKDQKLIVLKTSKDGWAHVKTDVVEGYVRSEYLQTAEE